MKSINIAQPQITKEEILAVVKVLKSGNLTSGEKVKKFEENFAEYIGTSYALAVANGTVALYLAIISMGIGAGDEVITTAFSFAAAVEAILWAGAIPVFVDIDPATFNIDAAKIPQAITPKTKAILPVHLYGQPADMEKIMEIGKKYHLKIIEDCAQAVGATTHTGCVLHTPGVWKKVGSAGDLGCFSFYATKNMTTGEGGMITTNSKEIYKRCLLLRNHGSEKRYHHSILGWNFRLTEMQAALGILQLKKLDKLNLQRQKNALYLSERLANIKGLITPKSTENITHAYHQYTIRITGKFPLSRDKFIEKVRRKGIGAEVYYPIPVHKQLFIKKFVKLYALKTPGRWPASPRGEPKDSFRVEEFAKKLPVTELASREVVSLPIHPGLSKKDLGRIVDAITSFASA